MERLRLRLRLSTDRLRLIIQASHKVYLLCIVSADQGSSAGIQTLLSAAPGLIGARTHASPRLCSVGLPRTSPHQPTKRKIKLRESDEGHDTRARGENAGPHTNHPRPTVDRRTLIHQVLDAMADQRSSLQSAPTSAEQMHNYHQILSYRSVSFRNCKTALPNSKFMFPSSDFNENCTLYLIHILRSRAL